MTRTAMTFQGKLMKLLSLGIIATGTLMATAATAAVPGITPVGDGSPATPTASAHRKRRLH